MSVPVLSYANPRDRRPWWKSYDAAVVFDLVVLPAVVFAIYWAWPEPRYYSRPSKHSDVITLVQSLRSQVALYRLHHDDRLPGADPLFGGGGVFNPDTFWDQMTQFTDLAGNTSATKTRTHVYGPYFQSIATNALNNSQTIAATAAPGVGFVYDFAGGAGTGKFWGVDATGALIPQ